MLLKRIADKVRAMLGDALWADFVAHANACYKDAFLSAFPKPVLRCVPPPHGGACPHNFRVDLTCERRMRRSVSCTLTTSRTWS